MGQKTNLTSLRLKYYNLDLASHSLNDTNIVSNLQNEDNLNQLLRKKGILVASISLNYSANVLYINLNVFFCLSKLLLYKRRANLKSLKTSKKAVSNFLNKLLKKQRVTNSIIKIKNLNGFINKKFSFYFFRKLRSHKFLFIRRFRLWIDFLKVLSLYSSNHVDSLFLLKILGDIFKKLNKRSHNKFFTFISAFFNFLIKKKVIKGFRFLMNGKLAGKPRSKSKFVCEGLLPTQSIAKRVSYSKLHVYTILGVFGVKLWIYK